MPNPRLQASATSSVLMTSHHDWVWILSVAAAATAVGWGIWITTSASSSQWSSNKPRNQKKQKQNEDGNESNPLQEASYRVLGPNRGATQADQSNAPILAMREESKKIAAASNTPASSAIILQNKQLNHHLHHLSIPSHFEREMRKEERRQRLIHAYAMKRPMYDNIVMLDPESHRLCTISMKKADWYIRKNLADWIVPNSHGNEDDTKKAPIHQNPPSEQSAKMIRLKFYPNNKQQQRRQSDQRIMLDKPSKGIVSSNTVIQQLDPPSHVEKACKPLFSETSTLASSDSPPSQNDPDKVLLMYNQSIKRNVCVVCGLDRNYRRHYIVPYSYRCRFPITYKTHMPHDVVLLCSDCHIVAERAKHRRIRHIERELRQQYERSITITTSKMEVDTSQPWYIDMSIHRVRSAAMALLNRKEHIPSDRIQQYEQRVHSHFCQLAKPTVTTGAQRQSESQNSSNTAISEELLQQAIDLDEHIPNPYYVSGPDLVMANLLHQIHLLLSSSVSTGDDGDTRHGSNFIHNRGRDESTACSEHVVVDHMPTSLHGETVSRSTTETATIATNTRITISQDAERALAEFVRSWRRHFVQTVQPRFLPIGWSIDAPVQCDRR